MCDGGRVGAHGKTRSWRTEMWSQSFHSLQNQEQLFSLFQGFVFITVK